MILGNSILKLNLKANNSAQVAQLVEHCFGKAEVHGSETRSGL